MFRLAISGLVALLCLAPPATAEFGKRDAVPAATLLLPYFEVNLDSSTGVTTLFSVNNADIQPAIAHVTVWTNFGIATFSWDIFLDGLDVQTLNLRDLFADGLVQNGLVFSEILNEEVRLALVAAHTGLPNTDTDLCSGFDFGDNIVRGYVTVDVMNESDAGFPFEAGYFVDGGTGKASNRNVLWGDYTYIDPANNFAQSEKLVHVEAGGPVVKGAPIVDTFYRFFVNRDGSDNREFLPAVWGAGYDMRIAKDATTDFIYWREPEGVITPFACGNLTPPEFPLLTNEIIAFDEAENPADVQSQLLFSLASGRTEVSLLNLPFEKGWAYLDLKVPNQFKGIPPFEVRQGHVFVVTGSQGRFSRGISATPLDSIIGN